MAALVKQHQHQGLLKMERAAKDGCYQTAILENRRLTKIINHLIVKARALRKKEHRMEEECYVAHSKMEVTAAGIRSAVIELEALIREQA